MEMQKKSHGETVLITGGSSGVGKALAHLFAKDGYRIILVAYDWKKLHLAAEDIEQAHNVEVVAIRQDLSEASAAQTIFDEISARGLAVDVLVNGAGYGTYGRFVETDFEKDYKMLVVNMLTLMSMTKLFMKPMLERRKGRILNIASIAAYQPGPFMSTYYASKAFVLSFTEALSYEMRKSGVMVSTLCAGPTKGSVKERPELQDVRVYQDTSIMVLPEEKVAKAAYRGLMRGKSVIIPGCLNRCFTALSRILPRFVVLSIVSWLDK